MSSVESRGSRAEEGHLWGARPRDWAEVQEATGRELYLAVLDALALQEGAALLDVGCGAGLFCSLAAERGGAVSGLDAAPELVNIARERTPDGDFQVGEMEALPYPDGSFDVVCLLNSLHYAAHPAVALREARRVARRGAPIVLGAWETGEGLGSLGLHTGADALRPRPRPARDDRAGSGRGAPRGRRSLGRGVADRRVPVHLSGPRRGPSRTAVLGAGDPRVEAAGEVAVREAVAETIAPFANVFGAYRMDNRYRFLVARTLEEGTS